NANNNQINLSDLNIKTSYTGSDDIKVEETQARSHDGTMVPISILYNKNVPLNGSATAILRGYDAYGINLFLPHFNTTNLALLNRGIVLAFAHIRGSSVKGEDWYKAGYKTTKPNTWKDFIACAKYLIK